MIRRKIDEDVVTALMEKAEAAEALLRRLEARAFSHDVYRGSAGSDDRYWADFAKGAADDLRWAVYQARKELGRR